MRHIYCDQKNGFYTSHLMAWGRNSVSVSTLTDGQTKPSCIIKKPFLHYLQLKHLLLNVAMKFRTKFEKVDEPIRKVIWVYERVQRWISNSCLRMRKYLYEAIVWIWEKHWIMNVKKVKQNKDYFETYNPTAMGSMAIRDSWSTI